MQKIVLYIFSVFTLLVACGTKKQTNSKTEELKTTTVVNDGKCTQLSDGVKLKKLNITINDNNRKNIPIPQDYEVYSIDARELQNLIRDIRQQKVKELNLPTPEKCYTFMIRPSGTMSEELQKKYPQLLSLRGTDDEQNFADIDYDGKFLRAKINTRMGVYLFEPYETNEGVYYLLFLLKSSGYPKSNFEQKNK